MAPTNPAEQAKQSLDSSIKRFLLEQCSGGSSRKEEVSRIRTEPKAFHRKGDPSQSAKTKTNLADIQTRRKPQLQESDNLWDDLGLESKNVTSVIETVRDVRGPFLLLLLLLLHFLEARLTSSRWITAEILSAAKVSHLFFFLC